METLFILYSIIDTNIYTIKTRLKYIYVRIYMSVCSKLIEETGKPPGLIFGMWGYFWPGSDKSSLGIFFTHLTEL